MLSRPNPTITWLDHDDQSEAVQLPPQPPSQPPPPLNGDWFVTHQSYPPDLQLTTSDNPLLLHPQTTSSHPLQQPHSLSSFLNVFNPIIPAAAGNPFDPTTTPFSFSSPDPAFIIGPGQTGPSFDLTGLEGFDQGPAWPKMLRPLEVMNPIGQGPGPVQPTLFQKRVMLRQGSFGSDGGGRGGGGKRGRRESEGDEYEYDHDQEEEGSAFDLSVVNYEDSDEFHEDHLNQNHGYSNNNNNNNNDNGNGDNKFGGNFSSSNMSSFVTKGGGGGGGDQKGKRKGLPAKNLMAERRRRKKLNDRLYMLRSVVPKISKVEG